MRVVILLLAVMLTACAALKPMTPEERVKYNERMEKFRVLQDKRSAFAEQCLADYRAQQPKEYSTTCDANMLPTGTSSYMGQTNCTTKEKEPFVPTAMFKLCSMRAEAAFPDTK